MKNPKFTTNGWLVAAAIAGTTVCASQFARAEEVVERRVVHEDVGTTESSPNRGLVMSGVLLFGATYIPSVVIASTSHYGPDNKLYIPVAGPWMDLADRKGECGRTSAHSCRHEDLYQALIIADGIGQGIGALQVATGFLFPVHRTVTTEAAWYVVPHMSPYMLGASALATF